MSPGGGSVNLKQVLAQYQPDCEQEVQELRMMLHYADAFSDILLRSNEIAHFTASSWIVNPARTHALMVYHNIYDSWSWTGGHADGDSDLLQVALREAREETSIREIRALSPEVFSVEILTVPAHHRRGVYVVPHLHLNVTYLLEADDAQQIHCKPDENSAVRWFPLDDAVNASTEPMMKIVYRKLNDKLRRFSDPSHA